MDNNAPADRIESILYLESHDKSNSESSPCDGFRSLEGIDLHQSQHEYSRTYPFMLFESSADIVVDLPLINPDRMA